MSEQGPLADWIDEALHNAEENAGPLVTQFGDMSDEDILDQMVEYGAMPEELGPTARRICIAHIGKRQELWT